MVGSGWEWLGVVGSGWEWLGNVGPQRRWELVDTSFLMNGM